MIREKIIICFGGDWKEEKPSSAQHLIRRFVQCNDVIWVNSIAIRGLRLTWYDIKKVVVKLWSWVSQPAAPRSRLSVYSPLVIPLHRLAWVRKINRFIVEREIRKRLRNLQDNEIILWIVLPTAVDFVGRFGERISLYYCYDELSAYPDSDTSFLKSLEAELLKKVALVIAISEKLAESKKVFNPNTRLVTHGVDFKHFQKACDEKTTLPEEMAAIPKPIIGYFGLLEEWIDFETIKFLAISRSDWSIVLVGGSMISLEELRPIRNIYILGHKDYNVLPEYVKAFDVAILPRKINELTIHMTPLKLMEYFASGKPVVASPLPAVLPYQEVVRVAGTKEEFLQAVSDCLEQDNTGRITQGIELARRETWERKADYLADCIEKVLVNIGETI